MDNVEYNDANRAFIQAFMARSSMTLPEVQPVLAAIMSLHEGRPIEPDDVTTEHLSSFISAANSAISPFDLEIRSSLHQASQANPQGTTDPTPERFYALVNTTSDALTQLATTRSADEIAFVKRILDYMFDTNNTRRCEGMAISSIQAIQQAKTSGDTSRRRSTNVGGAQANQGGTAQPLSMTQAENVMRQLVDEGWFEKSRKGLFTLTPRALMELRGWLVLTYNDDVTRIKNCAACKEIITVGQRCGDLDCPGRLHDHCMRNFFRMQQAEKCPVCKEEWPGDKFVGERAIAAQQGRPPTVAVQRETAPPSSMPNGHHNASEVEDGDEDEG
ncbi:Nse1 non-SMC component of SMC5-6 complex-domain-containing protein [Penicillium lagena]|uniref:Nse1 non-SMC component of SMC5-6 complex-domain-containing protein n=1 Tax=Penicillium lagena TaxID=94218 RepID=UPI00254073D4|nr:Nse1 non-SMC component of SMC5-6 complex-domain-containing protein [Penicillium lagena]KAJ5624767.1 Nse1 non-SMC component of SMC5-6 complex-domain-containing protein [Penicillium lagena]